MKKISTIISITATILYIFYSNFTSIYANEINNTENNPFEILCESVVLMDAKTGTVIYEKNSNEILYPASITKVMTALLAIENTTDYDERVYFSEEAVFSLPYGSSNIAMNDGETISMDEAMHAVLLSSANEVSNAVAEHISGTNEEFTKRMTARAKELGADNTNFLNPHGLHDDNHYTTAYDMGLIFREAIKREEFLKYISTISSHVPPTEKQEEERPLNNTNRLIIPGGKYYNEYVIGGKTGFTTPAAHTLVSYAVKDDMELIVVAMKGEKYQPYVDTNILFEYGFNTFRTQNIFDSVSYKKNIDVHNSNGDVTNSFGGYVKNSLSLKLPATFDKSKIQFVEDLTYQNEIKKDDVIGKLTLLYNGYELDVQDIYAVSDVSIIEETEITEEDASESNETRASAFGGNFDINNTGSAILLIIGIVGGLVAVALGIHGIGRLIGRGNRRKYKIDKNLYSSNKHNDLPKKKYKYKH